MRKFAFTCGDVNGIGPEIVIKSLNKLNPRKQSQIIFICPHNIFIETLKNIPAKFDFIITKNIFSELNKNKVLIYDLGHVNSDLGKPTVTSGKVCYNSIITACNFAKENLIQAIITAPISKLALHKAKINFPGHTELLADFFSVKKFAMMFLSNKIKAGLTSIHIPIKSIPKEITNKKLSEISEIIQKSLQTDFKIKNPKIAMLGLNPHAGENGKIGKEEIEIINPLIKKTKYLFGPFVPDAFFGNHLYKNFDATIGLYHDQILIPFKLMNFNSGVNFTAGLPIVRTSPDHGTAFDIAGKGIANPQSMLAAFKFAEIILKNRNTIF
ncbi:MAG: 4-hydroxythreonine-4-phosphate dehydrogenase PdxA [Ignavibacteriae bacterium]|nr:4-hydroxythreonine-4-phosphate dehydrogenase PdxA [Ignavibacteriota bacterium]